MKNICNCNLGFVDGQVNSTAIQLIPKSTYTKERVQLNHDSSLSQVLRLPVDDFT